MKSCVKKSKLYRKFCKTQRKADKNKYTAYRNMLKTLLRKAEQNYYSQKFKLISGNIKETWKLLGSALGNQRLSDVTNCFRVDGTDITDKREIVEKFNDYFVNILKLILLVKLKQCRDRT